VSEWQHWEGGKTDEERGKKKGKKQSSARKPIKKK